MKRATIDDIMRWEPCEEYPRERILKLMGDKTEVSALDVLGCGINAQYKLWFAARPFFFSLSELRSMTADFAEMVLPLFEREFKGDNGPRDTIEAARLFARGEITAGDLFVSRTAARAIAISAARAAARSVTDPAASATLWAASAASWAASWAASSSVRDESSKFAKESGTVVSAAVRESSRAAVRAVSSDAARGVWTLWEGEDFSSVASVATSARAVARDEAWISLAGIVGKYEEKQSAQR